MSRRHISFKSRCLFCTGWTWQKPIFFNASFMCLIISLRFSSSSSLRWIMASCRSKLTSHVSTGFKCLCWIENCKWSNLPHVVVNGEAAFKMPLARHLRHWSDMSSGFYISLYFFINHYWLECVTVFGCKHCFRTFNISLPLWISLNHSCKIAAQGPGMSLMMVSSSSDFLSLLREC